MKTPLLILGVALLMVALCLRFHRSPGDQPSSLQMGAGIIGTILLLGWLSSGSSSGTTPCFCDREERSKR